MMDINEIMLSPEDDATREYLLNLWFKQHDIVAIPKGDKQYQITNGCIKHIMFYPTKLKLMFQEPDGTNYNIQSKTDASVVGLIKGHIAYRRNK